MLLGLRVRFGGDEWIGRNGHYTDFGTSETCDDLGVGETDVIPANPTWIWSRQRGKSLITPIKLIREMFYFHFTVPRV